MSHTATRLALVTALALVAAPATGAHAEYKLANIMVSSVQPSAPTTGLLLPAVHNVRPVAESR